MTSELDPLRYANKLIKSVKQLGRGVIGSTTDSGSVSWGSSPCGLTRNKKGGMLIPCRPFY